MGQNFGPVVSEMRGAEHAVLQCDSIAIPDKTRPQEEEKHPIRPAAAAAAPERIVDQDLDQPQIRPGMQAFLQLELPAVLELD